MVKDIQKKVRSMGKMQIEKFIDNIDNITDLSEIEIRCKQEKSYIDANYSTLGSRKYTFTQYRNAVKNSALKNSSKKVVFDILKLNTKETLSYKEDYKQKVKQEQNNLKLIIDYQGYIAKAESLIRTNHFISSVLGFAALTGRRVAEIACSAKFQLHSPAHLMFAGQLKTKGRGDIGSYLVPCLTSPIEVITEFKRFRKNSPRYIGDVRTFHNNNSKDLSVQAKKHFSDYVEGIVTPKDLRAIYASISCKTIKANFRQSEQSYMADILGHDENDLNTCNSYIDYKIKD